MAATVPLLLLLLAASCRDGEATLGANGESLAGSRASACTSRMFEESRFVVCSAQGGQVEVRTADSSGQPYRSFTTLQSKLGERANAIVFAMNAGMFDEEGKAVGLLVEDGQTLHPINLRDGPGNFHMKPNGVFLVRRDGKVEVVTSAEFEQADDIAFATQSGPMLVIDGKLHPRFEPDGRSTHFRNGVGIGADGKALFVISADPVSLGKFGRFFRDVLDSKDALYFDGSVSSLWDPANGRRDSHAPLGPMVVVFRSAA